MSKSDDFLWDRSGEDPEVARLEALLSPLKHDAPLDEVRVRRRRRAWIPFVLAGVAAAAIVAVIAWPRGQNERERYSCGAQASGFAFTSRGGNVACGGASVA